MREARNDCDYHSEQDCDFEAMLRDALAGADAIISALPAPKQQ